PCIVGGWGYFMPLMGVEKMKAHWRYLIARYGAWPVVWCAAGEANLPYYLAKGFPYDDREQVHGWTEVLRSIRATDPWRRPLTIHPTAINRYTSRHATDDERLLDFDMLQTPHGQAEAAPVAVRAMRESYAAKPTMPVIDGEASYEMLNDNLPTAWTRAMFWLCLTNGAAGHTYGANGIWQVNRRGDPHGPSPHGGNYGKIAWDEAMRLLGSEQVALGKKFFESLPWTKLAPIDGAAAWLDEPANAPPQMKPVAPQTCGIGDGLLVIYGLKPQGIAVSRLRPNAVYHVTLFDPVTGKRTKEHDVAADANGSFSLATPHLDHDFVWLLERR
ncbi:MAG TPA: DUF4038 domain-containing protein, partial [Pirellulales bacterium]